MKEKDKDTYKTLSYLYLLATKFPENKSFLQRLIKQAQNSQIKLGKLKRTICFTCNHVLILGKNLEISYIKKQNGFGLLRSCKDCKNEKFYVFRGQR